MIRQDSIVLRGMITAIACAFTFVPAAQAASVNDHEDPSRSTAVSTHLSASGEREVILNPGEKATFNKAERAQISFHKKLDLKKNLFQAGVPAPNCIEAKVEKGGFIQVYNNCGGSDPQRVKVKIAFGPDTSCKSVQPGTGTNIGPLVSGRIDGIVLC